MRKERTSPPEDTAAYAQGAALVLEQLGVSVESGLTDHEAAARLERYGPNRLAEARRQSALWCFLLQFNNLLIYVLLGAAILAAAIGNLADAVVVLAVVILNAIIGFIQEGRAERAMEAIRGMIDPHASVLRDGRRLVVPAEIVRELFGGRLAKLLGERPHEPFGLVGICAFRAPSSEVLQHPFDEPPRKRKLRVRPDAEAFRESQAQPSLHSTALNDDDFLFPRGERLITNLSGEGVGEGFGSIAADELHALSGWETFVPSSSYCC